MHNSDSDNSPYRHRYLNELAALKEGWDSYGASPLDPRALAVADALAFIPSVNGGLQIELHAGGMDVEIEISEAGRVTAIDIYPVSQNEHSVE